MLPGGPGLGGGNPPPQQHAGIVIARPIKATVGAMAVRRALTGWNLETGRMAARAYRTGAGIRPVTRKRAAPWPNT
jgi:hypothetical protein